MTAYVEDLPRGPETQDEVAAAEAALLLASFGDSSRERRAPRHPPLVGRNLPALPKRLRSSAGSASASPISFLAALDMTRIVGRVQPAAADNARRQNAACRGARGNGMTSRMLSIPVA